MAILVHPKKSAETEAWLILWQARKSIALTGKPVGRPYVVLVGKGDEMRITYIGRCKQCEKTADDTQIFAQNQSYAWFFAGQGLQYLRGVIVRSVIADNQPNIDVPLIENGNNLLGYE